MWNSDDQTQPVVCACLVLHPIVKSTRKKSPGSTAARDKEQRLNEAVRLAEAIDLDIEHAETDKVARARQATSLRRRKGAGR